VRGFDQANILWMRPVVEVCQSGLAAIADARRAATSSATAAS